MSGIPADSEIDQEMEERWTRLRKANRSIFIPGEDTIQATLLSVLAQRKLEIAIRDFNEQSSLQAAEMITLTYWIKWLTIALGVIAVVQLVVMLIGGD